MIRTLLQSAVYLALATVTGCTTPPTQDRVTLAASHYSDAFDAAVATIRAKGLTPRIMDRRSGVIETAAEQTPSLLEPWATQSTDRELAALNTLGNTARKVRIEFSPAGGPPLAHSDAETLDSPDVLGLDLEEDLLTRTGPIDVRAWVWVERTYQPGRQLGSWTLGTTSWSRPIVDDPRWASVPKRVVVPEARDRGAERLLLAEITQRLDN